MEEPDIALVVVKKLPVVDATDLEKKIAIVQSRSNTIKAKELISPHQLNYCLVNVQMQK